MKITPLEIRQKTFEKVFRGYDKDEVQAYLHSLSMEWERMLDENKDLYHKIENLQAESSKLRELESSLFKTLKTAEDTGATLIEQAKKETDLKLKESAIKAERILTEARGKAKMMVENAESKKKQILDEMINKIRMMENLFNQITDLREKVVGQVKNYSNDLMERVEKLEKKSETLQIADLVAEAKKIYSSSILGEETDDSKAALEEQENAVEDFPPESSEVILEESIMEAEETKEPAVKDEAEKGDLDIGSDKKQVNKGGNPDVQDKASTDTGDKKKEEKPIRKGKDEQPEIRFNKKEKKSESLSKSFFDEIE